MRTCVSCGLARLVVHVAQMKRKSGPAWDHYCDVMRGTIGDVSKANREGDHGSPG